ncbi:MAG TPA: nucleoside-diphosphate sugar epimerase/dehydratase [Bryobacteraceae bacterium]
MLKLRSRHRRMVLRVLLASLVVGSLITAFLLRFEYAIPKSELRNLWGGLIIAVVIKMVAFYAAKCDRGGWRYSGIADLYLLLSANVLASLAFTVAVLLTYGWAFPRSVYCIDFLLCFLATAGARMAVRIYHESFANNTGSTPSRNILIYGAGSAAMALLREIRSNPALGWQVRGLLDDSPHKAGLTLMGVPVLGSGRQASLIVNRFRRKNIRIDQIVIAMPSVTARKMSEALANCRAAGLPCKTLPGVAALLTGNVSISQIRDVSAEDLLGRKPVRLDEELIRRSVEGASVMVTGGGGSIGSELCRQLASFRPARLVVFERAESDLFAIHRELTTSYAGVEIVPVIGDIREYASVERCIRRYEINSIFHAAAYKHVPVMENHVLEAIKNNVLGTRNLVNAAVYNGVGQFLMISSDKAVNPTNIMGLTKRVAELIVSALPNEGSGTKFVSVRFGNVLGSNGSVVPLFREQIAAGGPVTVTHPEMRRYFMTISEAVQLVLQASAMCNGSEIFVLDMGDPVPIVNLAREMIRLSGYEPDVDIEIRYTGTRPGEKLFEELVLDGEEMLPTYHEKIRIFRGSRLSCAAMDQWLTELQSLVSREDELGILTHLKELVPEYQPVGAWRELMDPAQVHAAAAS